MYLHYNKNTLSLFWSVTAVRISHCCSLVPVRVCLCLRVCRAWRLWRWSASAPSLWTSSCRRTCIRPGFCGTCWPASSATTTRWRRAACRPARTPTSSRCATAWPSWAWWPSGGWRGTAGPGARRTSPAEERRLRRTLPSGRAWLPCWRPTCPADWATTRPPRYRASRLDTSWDRHRKHGSVISSKSPSEGQRNSKYTPQEKAKVPLLLVCMKTSAKC